MWWQWRGSRSSASFISPASASIISTSRLPSPTELISELVHGWLNKRVRRAAHRPGGRHTPDARPIPRGRCLGSALPCTPPGWSGAQPALEGTTRPMLSPGSDEKTCIKMHFSLDGPEGDRWLKSRPDPGISLRVSVCPCMARNAGNGPPTVRQVTCVQHRGSVWAPKPYAILLMLISR